MSQVKSKQITQPEDWWELFKQQAYLEGLTLSEWIGNCCRDRCIRAAVNYEDAKKVIELFSPRPSKGPAKGTKRKPKEPKDEK